jgi:pyruvate dehydrogenase E2 component (dihydrolipoamide acetyltransferase)
MAEYVRMPQKGLTEESAILSKWYVKPGDTVKPGQLLFSLETGKATFDVEAEVEGTILERIGEEGDEIAVKTVVCVIGTPGESYTRESVPNRMEGTGSPEKTRISPRARRLAAQNGVRIEELTGTGPGGRIIEEDVRAVLIKKEASPESSFKGMPSRAPTDVEAFERIPVGGIRKTIAGTMMQSLHGMAQFTITASFDATELLAYRERYNASHSNSTHLSINDCILFAVSRVILDFPYLNAHYADVEIRRFKNVHLGVAVDTPKGLLVPTIRNAEGKTLTAISAEAKGLTGKCREGRISPEEISSATFTVTNLGAFGVEFFTPIINPPQTGILGVGTIEYKRKKVSSGMVDYPAMGLSLTVDHRAVDGAPAARFLQALIGELEQFPLLLVK